MLDVLWDAGLLESQGPRRYTLQQTIADYARTQAKDSQAQQQLVYYMLEYIQTHKQDYKALELEINNILAALDSANSLNMSDAVINGITALAHFMRIHGLYIQADHYLQLALKAAMTLGDQIGCMTVLHHLAAFGCLCGEYTQAEAYGQQGLALAQDLGQIDVESDLLTTLGHVAFHRSDSAQSTVLYEQGLQLAHQLGDDLRISTLLCYLGKNVSFYQDNHIRAESLYQEGLTIAQQSGHQELIAVAQYGLAQLAVLRGDVKVARRLGKQCLATFEALEHYWVEKVRDWLHSLPTHNGVLDETSSKGCS
jgi:tetratricopeptide (TPR) repeat protein